MRKLLSLFLALMLALSCLYVQAESFASDYAAMNDAAASVLVLTLYDENDKELGTASGFMAFDERHAVTTWLAVSSAKRIKAVSDEGKELGAFKLLGCDSDCNLAILAFDEPTGLKPLPLNAEEGVRRGAACVSIGAQNGYNSITTGNIANSFTMEGMDLIQFTASISDGASGGALLDENGKVAAVTMFGLSGEIGYTVVQNMNFALSARHIAELWNYCKDDEPVELENWGITDINPDSTSVQGHGGKKFTVINDSGYKLSSLSISAVRARGEGYEQVKNLSLNWVEKGKVIDFELDYDTELEGNESLEIAIGYSGSYGSGTIFKRYSDLEDFFGKTFSLTVNLSANALLLTVIEDNSDALVQRHMKEAAEAEDDFEIPETIDRKRNIPDNQLIVVNETSAAIKAIAFSYRYKGKDRHVDCLTKKLYPGDHLIIELPEELEDIDPNMYCSLMITLENGRYTDIYTRDTSVFHGKVILVKYNEETRQYYNEMQ